jgi:hypothetical protein
MQAKRLLCYLSAAIVLAGCAHSSSVVPQRKTLGHVVSSSSVRLHRASKAELAEFYRKFPQAARHTAALVEQTGGGGGDPSCDYGDASQGYCDKYGTDPPWMSSWETIPTTGWGRWVMTTICWGAEDCTNAGYPGYDVAFHLSWQFAGPPEQFPLIGRFLGGGDTDQIVGYDDCLVASDNLSRIQYANRVRNTVNRIKDPSARPGYVNGIGGFIQQLQTAWRATQIGQAKVDAEFYQHAGDFFGDSYPNLTSDEMNLYNAMARYPAAATSNPLSSPFLLGQNGNTVLYLMENQAWRDAGAGMILKTNLPEYYVSVFNSATNKVVTIYPVSFSGAVKALAQLFSVSENDIDAGWDWPTSACSA